jgi:hypothetical protein
LPKENTAPVKNSSQTAPAKDTQATKKSQVQPKGGTVVRKTISKTPVSSLRQLKEIGSAVASNKTPLSHESVQTQEDKSITSCATKPRKYVLCQKIVGYSS